MTRIIALFVNRLFLGIFYSMIFVCVALEAMVFKLFPLHDDNVGLKLYLAYIIICAVLLHKLAKEWLPEVAYHIVMTIGILFSLLTVLYVGTILGWAS